MTDTYKTQCPNCQATYEVGINELSTGNKKARCGRCKYSFLMREHLVTESLIQPDNNKKVDTESAKESLKKRLTQAQAIKDSAAIKAISEKALNNKKNEEKLNKSKKANNSIEPMDDNAWLEDLLREEQTTHNPHASSGVLPSDEHGTSSLNSLLKDIGVQPEVTSAAVINDNKPKKKTAKRQKSKVDTPQKRAGKSPIVTILWGLGCATLLSLLVAQYVIFNLDTLLKDAQNKQRLQSFCNIASCSLPNADLSSFLVSRKTFRTNATNSNQTDIIAALTNKSGDDQLYPALKVTLQGNSGLLGEFIAAPEQYLVVPQRLIGGKQSILIMLTVDVPSQDIKNITISTLY